MPHRRFLYEIELKAPVSKSEVRQELVIHPDGSVEIPWITPAASALILAVWEDINRQPFPIRVISGQLYCG